jgi:hypothetical protein
MPLTMIIFLLLTYLPHTLSTPATDSSKSTDTRTGCLNSRNLFNTLIFFRTDSDPEVDFAIKTSYTAYYPKAIKSDLRLSGFQILDSFNACNWQKSMSVRARSLGEVGRHRGDVY